MTISYLVFTLQLQGIYRTKKDTIAAKKAQRFLADGTRLVEVKRFRRTDGNTTAAMQTFIRVDYEHDQIYPVGCSGSTTF
jgi:hypothetical protein